MSTMPVSYTHLDVYKRQELDHAADQMVKQIQLSGGVNSETDELFEFLSSQIEGAENIAYSVDATYTSPRPSGMTNAIQLGTPFLDVYKRQILSGIGAADRYRNGHGLRGGGGMPFDPDYLTVTGWDHYIIDSRCV